MERNKTELTLGSLFSGSGGFELAGTLAGIKPVFNSEVEPFPIAVTCKRFPDVKHYGDVSAMDGGKIEPVDIITFGSPCQDMSIAGKRSGLDGERSSLFYEAVRIVKEMRCATNGKYPRYIVWENVPGTFSSNGGEDFVIKACPIFAVTCIQRKGSGGMILADIAVAITLPVKLFWAKAPMVILFIFADAGCIFTEFLVFLFGNGNLLIQRVQIDKTCFFIV